MIHSQCFLATHVKIMASGEGSSSSSGARSVELLPLYGAISSKVWSHFGFPASSGNIIEDRKSRKHVHCKLCPKILNYPGNTSNMRFNLQNAHGTTYKDVISGEEPHKPKPRKYTRADYYYGEPPTNAQFINTTETFVYFITKDMQPLDSVEEKGFLHLLHQSYTGVTVHFITTKFKIESCLLETREFVESHSAENIMLEESVDQ